MLDATKIGRQTALTSSVGIADEVLRIPTGVAAYFNPLDGTHYYATLVDGQRREVVQVTGAVGTELHVRRGQDHTPALAFAGGTCLIVEWNPQQLREFIVGVGQGEPTHVSPGVYCLDCTTCIEVNAGGRIVSIDGATSC